VDVNKARLPVISALVFSAVVCARAASAQTPTPTPTPAPAPPVQTPEPTPTPAPVQVAPGGSKALNPDISVIGNFVGVAGKNPFSSEPPFQLTEAEMALQAAVDPYARADFFLSAGPDGLEVEEGFITFNTLPGGLLLKAGKLRAQFGKVNTLHTHALSWADRPLVTNSLVGGEEGISDAGLSVSKLIPNSFMFFEATGEVFSGRSAVFQSAERSKLNYVGRLRGYRDLTEGTNLDLGVSFAHGPTDVTLADPTFAPVGTQYRQLVGVDATFRYRPLRRAIYKRFLGRTEWIWSRQDVPTGEAVRAFGMYASGEYQFARRWYAGARFDRSGRPFDGDRHDTGGSFFLTYWPSEFSQIRWQYRRVNFAEGLHANEVLLQLNFAIGAHGAHVF
jgi:hypothetical protein